MISWRLWVRVAVLGLLLSCSIAVWVVPFAAPSTSEQLEVHFLDVGQGDAILVESPSGQQMLIDGGPDSTVVRLLARELGFFDRTIDYVLATHPDSDHIGGLVDVLERYNVQTYLTTDATADTDVFRALEMAVETKGIESTQVRRGDVFDLGAGVQVGVLWPEVSVADVERNAGSIVLRVTYGEISFLLTGDAPKRIEEYMVLSYGEHLKSSVLKVGHHGSRTSTSELFLSEVVPQYAVISAGEDNSYGHPHVEVTDLLFNKGIETISTAASSTVTFVSNGEEVMVK